MVRQVSLTLKGYQQSEIGTENQNQRGITMRSVLLFTGLFILMSGCSAKKPVDTLPTLNPATAGQAGKTDAMEVNQIRKEYDSCIQKKGPKDPACLELQWTYEDALSHFESDNNRTPVK